MKLFENKVNPDFDSLRDCILQKKKSARVHAIELYQDQIIKDAVANRYHLLEHIGNNDPYFAIKKEIAVQHFLGYDMIQVLTEPKFSLTISDEKRAEGHSTDEVAYGPIQSWEDFESYQWPDISQIDLGQLEWLEKNIPDGMKCYSMVSIGLYKVIIGMEAILYKFCEEPDLISAVLSRIKRIYVDYCNLLSQFSCIGALWSSDDMGFKTQTFLPPDFIKSEILPVHAACAEVAHRNKKLFFLHSCGNLSEIMDSIIDVVGIDAKHSYEDMILPVEEAYILYGKRVAILGGIDMDFLCRADEQSLRTRVRKVLDICHEGGGYCLGSGNSIANYVPLENYLIMLDEGRRHS
jgi:uroporphyrinogen decarboxylase